jgi:LSD1 subclass zinc finger protein
MNIDLKQFAALQKSSKASFFEQQKLLKKITAGKSVLCESCKKPLTLYTPGQSELTGIRCAKGCTDIALDFA